MLQAVSQQYFITTDGIPFQIVKKVPDSSLRFFQAAGVQFRGHHGSQRKGNCQRHQGGEHDGEAELTEQLTRSALHESDGQKYDHVAQGHGDRCHADLHTSLLRGVSGIVSVLQETVDVFQYDNGVVNQDADTGGHAHEGHHIESESCGIHQKEGGNQGSRNRNHNRRSRTPATQEEIQDQTRGDQAFQ